MTPWGTPNKIERLGSCVSWSMPIFGRQIHWFSILRNPHIQKKTGRSPYNLVQKSHSLRAYLPWNIMKHHESKVGTDDEGYELHPRFRAREGEIVVARFECWFFAFKEIISKHGVCLFFFLMFDWYTMTILCPSLPICFYLFVFIGIEYNKQDMITVETCASCMNGEWKSWKQMLFMTQLFTGVGNCPILGILDITL